MAALMPQGKQQYFTAGGIPLVGGKVYTYAAGTTTPLATYTTAAASTPNTNPVILDSRGEASIFFSAANYKIVVKDSLDSTIWTQDNLAGDQAATILAALAASTGSSLVGHLPSGTGAIATTVQQQLRNIQAWYVNVKDAPFYAKGDGSTDDIIAIQAAIDYVNSLGGGVVFFPTGDYHHSTPIKSYSNVSLIGAGQEATKLTKTGSGTLALTGPEATASNATLVCLDLAKMSDGSGNVNCSIWLSDSGRAEYVEIAHMTIRSTGSAATTALVRIGICGIGASTSYIHDLNFEYFSVTSIVLPTYFASSLQRVKSYRCGQGPSFEAGTSVEFLNNYSIYCQKYGYYFRDMLYISVIGNACDGLNNVTNASDYTDRTVDSKVYVFNACSGVTFESNGAEECFGSHVYMDSCIGIGVKNNTFLHPASSYTGANQVALFYINSFAQDTTIENNVILRAGTTAIQGAANAANHHDLYVSVASQNQGFKFVNNLTANNKYDSASTIYGNIVPTYISTISQTAQICGTFTPTVSLLNATGVAITYGADNVGRYHIVNDWMFVDVQIHLAAVAYTPTGAVYVSADSLPFVNKSGSSAFLEVTSSSNFTWPTTEAYWVTTDTNFASGLIRSRTGTTIRADASAFASGATDVKFHFSGQVYIGNVVSVV